MITVTGSTLNHYPIPRASELSIRLLDIVQDKVTAIRFFFAEANVDVTNNPEAHAFQESLKDSLIFSSVAENIGVPRTVIIDDFKGFRVEFTLSERTYFPARVLVKLISLQFPKYVVPFSIDEAPYSEIINNFLEEERQAIRKRYREEVDSMYHTAFKALQKEKMTLISLSQEPNRNVRNNYIKQKFHHFNMYKRSADLTDNNINDLPNISILF